MMAYLVYQCLESFPSLCGNWLMKSSSEQTGPNSDAYMAPVCSFSSERISFSLIHPQLSLLLHLAVAHLGRIIRSKVIRFFTLAQYTFIQTIISVSSTHLNRILPSPPGCGLQDS